MRYLTNTSKKHSQKYNHKHSLTAAALIAVIGLTGCSDDDDDSPAPEPVTPTTPVAVMQTYTVTVTNLTANQPMSPIAIASHSADVMLWQAGEAANVALEKIAEGGDAADVAAIEGVNSTVSGAGILMPGMSETITVTLDEADVANLTVATMLVNTNDAFTGLNSYDITMLAVDESVSMRGMVYDAGTEANSEAKGTMPGPADGGEGYNSERDDVDFVHIHPGVITMYDGLMDSVLTPSHRFDNPAVAISISRTE
ncbi:spondin domain-containing protein [Shewanella olleyana]|uniref:spondin domain-containing protein n=1 Tax=Shewanella olleyana TaxID=135626 RepID=UPI00200C6577|nr:spondin domain-containing protein [Shewanella olleyana]MCL1068638.1 spondin domain-containing protein [Shewanella olleyana]